MGSSCDIAPVPRPVDPALIYRFGLIALGLGAGVWGLAGLLAADAAARLAAIAVFGAGAVLAGAGLRMSYPHPRIGLCNAVTLLRAALGSALVAPLMVPGAGWGVVAVAATALLLDGVDGWLARRSALVSDFGARFDMEVDAGLALILSLLAAQGGTVGPWVLALGSMRYVYVAAGRFLPWLRAPLPQRFRRKLVCVVQIGALILLVTPGTAPVAGGVAALATGLVLWSFALDTLWLARRR